MFGDVLGDPARLRVHRRHPHAQLTVPQLVVQMRQDAVARGAHDLGVEAAVGRREGGQVARRGVAALLVQQLLQAGQQPLRGGHHLHHRVALHEQPGLHDVRDLLRGDRQHQGALLRVELQQALGLQAQQCLADRGARDAHGLGQLALAQEGAALVAAVEDGLFDVRVDPLGGGRLLGGRLGGGAGGRDGAPGHDAHIIDTRRMHQQSASGIRTGTWVTGAGVRTVRIRTDPGAPRSRVRARRAAAAQPGDVGGGLGAPLHPELGEQGGDVVLDRLLGEVQPVADLPVGEALADEVEDPLLLVGQVCEAALLAFPAAAQALQDARGGDRVQQ